MPLKNTKSKTKQLPQDMERAIRDYHDNKKIIKEKVFEGESKSKSKSKPNQKARGRVSNAKPKVKNSNKKNNSKRY